MNTRIISITAVLLWAITIAVAAVFFIKGNTEMSDDKRVSVILKPVEKSFVLLEMRMLLEGVQGITEGLAKGDMKHVSASARSIGTAAAADVNPALMMKLPVGFKQQGMAVHEQFDVMADKIDAGASSSEALLMLSEQLSSCVACHSIYRLETASSKE